MFKLSPTMVSVLGHFLDGNPKSIKNDLGIFGVRWPTLVSLHQRHLIRPEKNEQYQRCWTMRFIITKQGKLELIKRGYSYQINT